MSQYANFITDFPSRCLDILKRSNQQSVFDNREVTLTLSIATAGLVMPFERLRSPSEDLIHPAREIEKFQAAKIEFDKLLDTPFLGSILWNTTSSSWIFSKEIKQVEKEPDFWEELKSPKALTPGKKVVSIVKHLRNALAHGNIYTTGNPINRIIFLSRCCVHENGECKPIDKFALLAASPDDFRKLLVNWLGFLSKLPTPTSIIQGTTFELLEYVA